MSNQSKSPQDIHKVSKNTVNTITFGPVLSRRFGTSLGVDLSPQFKQCNFDCLYCELKAAKSVDSMSSVVSVKEILQEIKTAIKRIGAHNLSVLTFTANGEPTLYPHLYELIVRVKEILPSGINTLILSNGSLFWKVEVARALREFDIVKFSLDSVIQKHFSRIDRPHKDLDLERIKNGIKSFSTEFSGTLVGEILLLKGINDSQRDAISLAQFLKEVCITRLDISTLDRPPAHKALPLSFEEMQDYAKHFSGLNVCLPTRAKTNSNSNNSTNPLLNDISTKEIIESIARRPLSADDIHTLFSPKSQKLIAKLIDDKVLAWEKVGNVDFLKVL